MAKAGTRPRALRRRIHLVLEGRAGGTAGLIFETVLITLIVLNVLAVALDSVPAINAAHQVAFTWFEVLSVGLFTIEYALRLWTAPEEARVRRRGAVLGRLVYAGQPLMIIDLLAIAPAYVTIFIPFVDLRVLRLFRLLRLLKVARYSPALSTLWFVIVSERRALLGTLILLISVMCFSAEALYLIEGHIQSKVFGTLPDAMWWAITTLTTVGYGDAVPLTALGKIAAGITMIVGLGLFALPVGIVATGFANEIHRRDFVVTWSMLSRLPLLEGFDADVVGDVMNALRSHAVPTDTEITLAGERPHEMYFIESGRAEAETPEGEVQTFGPGDFFGEAELLHGHPHETTIVARTPMRLLALSNRGLHTLVRKHSELRKRIEELSAEREHKPR